MDIIPVTTGAYLVEIPEADLSILCGCPADIIKHMKNRGLIVQKVENGVFYESGPNAILLSDVPVQNGQFANLAEFPLLHMLYFQGMGVPKHPNNTGRKPIFIGSENQISAQSHYIYRGRYGLASEKELKEAGLNDEEAAELFRIKKLFAHGKIEPPEEQIEKIIVGQDPRPIREGVTIRRLKINVFCINSYGQEITIDLNLESGKEYEPAVSLDFHRVRKEYFSVLHIGEGDGWDITRPCMSSVLSFQGKYYLIDAGPYVINSLQYLGISINEIEGIFHTHAHDDHFAGLTSLMYTDHRIKYFSSKMVRKSVMKKLSALLGVPENKCEQSFVIQDLDLNTWNNLDGLMVMPNYSPHPVDTNTFMFRTPWKGGYKQYMHLADISSVALLKKMLLEDKEANELSKQIFTQMQDLYLQETDIKKVDIGGGMIHGDVYDFAADKTSKILLSHHSRHLTFEEKEVGSSASFGMVDSIIESNQDYLMRGAYTYIAEYFPNVPEYEIRLLLNSSVVMVNVGDIIMKKDSAIPAVFVILSGVVEVIDTDKGMSYTLSAGSIIGEAGLLLQSNSPQTYRAASYVNLLMLDVSLFQGFILRNYDVKLYRSFINTLSFFQQTRLFGEHLSSYKQSRIVRTVNEIIFKAGEEITQQDAKSFFLVHSGKVSLFFDKKEIEQVQPGDFFGEDNYFYQGWIMTPVALTDVQLYQILLEPIKDIPILEWKLQERFDRRLATIGALTGDTN